MAVYGCSRRGRKRGGGALSIAEYCNRSYSSSSSSALTPSNIHDVIFSVHFTSATGDVRLQPTSLDADDRQRLDADFHVDDDPEVSPYATFSEIQAAAAAAGSRWEPDPAGQSPRPAANGAGTAGADERRPRPRRADKATAGRDGGQDRLHDAQRHTAGSTDNDLTALYAQPHKLIMTGSGDHRHTQSQI